jgi:hypothetical protein
MREDRVQTHRAYKASSPASTTPFHMALSHGSFTWLSIRRELNSPWLDYELNVSRKMDGGKAPPP